jgi:hypothetical protein
VRAFIFVEKPPRERPAPAPPFHHQQEQEANAWSLTGCQMGERGDDALMGEVALAMQTTDLDQKRLGSKLDAKRRKTKLAGFIRSKG